MAADSTPFVRWFINEDGVAYDYALVGWENPTDADAVAAQSDHFPGDDHTPYLTEEAAQKAADDDSVAKWNLPATPESIATGKAIEAANPPIQAEVATTPFVVAYHVPHNEGVIFGVITGPEFDTDAAMVDLFEVDASICAFPEIGDALGWLEASGCGELYDDQDEFPGRLINPDGTLRLDKCPGGYVGVIGEE